MLSKSRVMRLLLPIALIVLFSALPAFAADSSKAAENAGHFGIFTILPPLVAIALAFITRNVILSLFFGTFTGCYMLAVKGTNVFLAFLDGFMRLIHEVLASISDTWNAGIILQVLTIGSLIALVTKMGGITAIAEGMSKFAKNARSSQFVTWFLGLFIFFDDYANALIVGPMMRPVTDKMKISRERLSFIIDATAAPVAGMALISTWVAYEVGLINDALSSIGSTYNAYGTFVASLPFRFYNIFILLFIVVTAYMLRDFGAMYKAEYRARTTGEVLRKGSTPMAVDTMEPLPAKNERKSSIWYAIIPILTLIIGAFVGFYVNGYNNVVGGEDAAKIAIMTDSPASFAAIQEAFGASDASIVLFTAALVACIVAIIMGLVKKLFTVKESLDTFLAGLKSMNITALILLLAWSLSGTIKELGTAAYIVEHLSGAVPVWSLPAIIFILGSIISFATGTSYGTMGILMPLAVPLAWAIMPTQDYVVLNVGAVLTGAIFGDHCSPISDTTILSSMGSAVDLMDHVQTQILYAVVIAILSIGLYIMAGFGISVWLVLPIGAVAVILFVRFVGKKLPDAEPAA